MKISVITPFYNEIESLPTLYLRLTSVLSKLDDDYELVLIDDHSNDGSDRLVQEWASSDSRVVYVRLARNSGSHAACSAGLQVVSGDCAVLIAADLQDPPETIPELVEKWKDDFQVVWAVRSERQGESKMTLFFASVYYWLMRKIALPEMPSQGADFVLVDRRIIDVYNSIPEKHTSILAMILWIGFRQTSVYYVKQARHAGVSKWTFSKRIKLMIDSLFSFSYAPIRAMSFIGMIMALGGFLYAAIVIVGRLIGYVDAGTGFAAIMVALLIGQGLVLTMMGVLGEYLWRTFDESRGRPRYVIEKCMNTANPDKKDDEVLSSLLKSSSANDVHS